MAVDNQEDDDSSWISDPMMRCALTGRPLVATVVHLVPAGLDSQHRIFVHMEVHVPKKCFPVPFSEHQDEDIDMAEWDECYARMCATVAGYVRGYYGPNAFVRDAEETPANEDDLFIGSEVISEATGQKVVLARFEVEELDMFDPKGVDRHDTLRHDNCGAQLREDEAVRRRVLKRWKTENPDS